MNAVQFLFVHALFMSRNVRTRRLIPGANHLPLDRSAPQSETSTLLSLFARSSRLTDVLPCLHQHALSATGGSCSLLFEHNPRNGVPQATSAYGVLDLGADPWQPGEREEGLIAETFARGEPTLIAELEQQMPDLATRLGQPAALLIPLVRNGERLGLLAVGFAHAPQATVQDAAVAAVADAFITAIELFRLRRNQDVQQDIRALLDDFAAGLAQSMNVGACLERFCESANRLFAADRTSVWIHDRHARDLVLQASSDPAYLPRAIRVEADDPAAPAASALRHARAGLISGAEGTSTATLTVPLRGCRRALGTLVFDDVRIETGGELDCLDRADELGRQLSATIETMQLLDEVVRSRRELENIFDSITHLVVVADQRGTIAHANLAFASRLGLSREQLLGRPLVGCVGSELATWLRETAGSLGPAGESQAVARILDSRLGGPLFVTVTDLVDRDGHRLGHVLVARDLTPQAKLEADGEELRRQLTQSEKLAALGQFVAGIAHELNNPLQSVLGHLELLRTTGAFPNQLKREVQTIYREADRAARIVRNLLVFTGSRRRLVRRPVSLNALMQRVVALRQAACRTQNIEIVRRYDEGLPRVKSDALLLHQAFLNMLMNAEQAIAAAGRPGRIEITTARADGNKGIVVTIRDNGDGLPPEAMSRVFEPFYTTKEVGKGTGLGLAIAYGIVQDHGGQIAVANHPDGGALFTVELPSGASA